MRRNIPTQRNDEEVGGKENSEANCFTGKCKGYCYRVKSSGKLIKRPIIREIFRYRK